MRLLLILFCALLPAQAFDYTAWQALLTQRVSEIGEVDYAAIKADRKQLDAVLARIAETSPVKDPGRFPKRQDQLAFWINAYNALMIDATVQKYPLKSVKNIGLPYSVFRRKDHTVGGQKMSLDNIEHDILRGQMQESRVHFALVCASVSCPVLQNKVYLPETVNAQLDAAARQFLCERRNFELAGNTLYLSKIFDWYGKDFVKNGKNLLEGLSPWMPAGMFDKLKVTPRVEFRTYDWGVNEPGSRARSRNEAEKEVGKGCRATT